MTPAPLSRGRRLVLDGLGCFLIPLYTLLFAHDTRWFTTNFSVIASLRDQRHGFFVWALLVGGYLLGALLPVISGVPNPALPGTCLVLGFLLLMAGVILPYVPQSLPLISGLHVILTFSACVLLVLCLFFLIGQLMGRRRVLYGECMGWLGVTVAISLILFALVGFISSALEIFFTLSCTLLSRRLRLLLAMEAGDIGKAHFKRRS